MGRFRLPWQAITHQVITHFHLDHVHDLPALFFSLKYGRAAPRSEPLTVIGPKGLEAILWGFVGLYRMRILDQEFPVAFREIEPPAEIDLGNDVRLRAIRVPHTPESLAIRMEAGGRSLGYTGDTAPSEDLVRFFQGIDLLLAECSFVGEKHDTPHLNAEEVSVLASAAHAKHLVAVHSYFDPEAERLTERLARRFDGRITVPRDGETLDV